MALCGSAVPRLALFVLCLTVLITPSRGHSRRHRYTYSCDTYPCNRYVAYTYRRYRTCETRYLPHFGLTHRRLADSREMYHIPAGDASDEACKLECHRNIYCTGYEYTFAPSHPGNPEVFAALEQALNDNTTAQVGGRYLGETAGMYHGPDCYQRCTGIRTTRVYDLWDDPDFIRDDPYCTFYRRQYRCRYSRVPWLSLSNKCGHCLPPPTTTTTTTTAAPDPGCVGDDFANTEVVTLTGLPVITDADTDEDCANQCLAMTIEQCSGYQFVDGTCFRWDQNAEGVTVDCDNTTGVLLHRRLDPDTCELPGVTPPGWTTFAGMRLPGGLGLVPVLTTPFCCILACNYRDDCCAVDYNSNFGGCIYHSPTDDSIPHSCGAFGNAGDVSHFAKPLASNPCQARYGELSACAALTPA